MSYRDDEIRKRIKRLMHREGLNQTQFAEKIGKSQPQVSDIMRGKVKITDNFIQEIYDAFPQITEGWLTEGESPMYEGDKNTKAEHPTDTRPRLPKKFMQANIEDFLEKHRSLCQEKQIITQFADYEFTIILKNNRMSPKYERGDELAFRKASIVEWGNDYLLDTDEGPKFKRVFEEVDEDGNRVVRCVSYNKPEYPDFTIPLDKINEFYKCVGVIRIL